jgi:effector-binding domain-containing protein
MLVSTTGMRRRKASRRPEETPMSLRKMVLFAALALTLESLPATAQAPAQPLPSQLPPEVPPPPPKAAPQQSKEVFGEEVTLAPKTIVYLQGAGNWDSAYETLVEAFKTLYGFLEKDGVKPSGPPMTIYTETDDTGFKFQAGVPVAEAPKTPPRGDIAVGTSPAGRSFKFVHRGAYDSMDTMYEAITNFLDERKLEARDMFVEEYVTDPVKTPEDKLVIHVIVPVK